jgi:hypothetical protein
MKQADHRPLFQGTKNVTKGQVLKLSKLRSQSDVSIEEGDTLIATRSLTKRIQKVLEFQKEEVQRRERKRRIRCETDNVRGIIWGRQVKEHAESGYRKLPSSGFFTDDKEKKGFFDTLEEHIQNLRVNLHQHYESIDEQMDSSLMCTETEELGYKNEHHITKSPLKIVKRREWTTIRQHRLKAHRW